MTRRKFIVYLAGITAALLSALFGRLSISVGAGRKFLRPPGAISENRFLSACIRCGKCAAVCPRACIKFHTFSDGIGLFGAPYIEPRARACNLCMNCAGVCPTGALEAIPAEKEAIINRVYMGTAVVNTALCISFLGRLCGECRDACPFPGEAIKLESWARPKVIEDKCVGCGLCVEVCPQEPTAIRVDTSGERRRI
ncbi:MAG: hypothetical protein Kow0090_16040 [Myxococcota bacterium]